MAYLDGKWCGETATGNLRRARLSDVCLWVKRAWDAIYDETIIESFNICKISTDLNGSDSELEISDDDDWNNVDDDNEGSDDASGEDNSIR